MKPLKNQLWQGDNLALISVFNGFHAYLFLFFKKSSNMEAAYGLS